VADGWIDAYLDHYAKFLHEPVQARPYSLSEDLPPIQILEYDRVIAGCRVFASLGLTEYFPGDENAAEVICPVDKGWDEIPDILAHMLFRVVTAEKPVAPERGGSVDGLEEYVPDFAKKYKKTSLYFTDPYGLPEEFAFVPRGKAEGRMYLAMFLTKKEHAFLLANDCEALEDKFELKAVDPYDLGRRSCV
jgi:hypothetical protein